MHLTLNTIKGVVKPANANPPLVLPIDIMIIRQGKQEVGPFGMLGLQMSHCHANAQNFKELLSHQSMLFIG